MALYEYLSLVMAETGTSTTPLPASVANAIVRLLKKAVSTGTAGQRLAAIAIPVIHSRTGS